MADPVAPPLDQILQRPESGPRSVVDMALKHDPSRPAAAAPPQRRRAKTELNRMVRNVPVLAPRVDWAALTAGSKRQYRTYSGSWHDRFKRLVPEDETFPRPALLYTPLPENRCVRDTALMVIEAYRQEPLGEISSADLWLEGFDMPGKFKRYWKLRHPHLGWRPADRVSVVTLRPWEEQDDEELAAWLLDRLYGEWR